MFHRSNTVIPNSEEPETQPSFPFPFHDQDPISLEVPPAPFTKKEDGQDGKSPLQLNFKDYLNFTPSINSNESNRSKQTTPILNSNVNNIKEKSPSVSSSSSSSSSTYYSAVSKIKSESVDSLPPPSSLLKFNSISRSPSIASSTTSSINLSRTKRSRNPAFNLNEITRSIPIKEEEFTKPLPKSRSLRQPEEQDTKESVFQQQKVNQTRRESRAPSPPNDGIKSKTDVLSTKRLVHLSQLGAEKLGRVLDRIEVVVKKEVKDELIEVELHDDELMQAELNRRESSKAKLIKAEVEFAVVNNPKQETYLQEAIEEQNYNEDIFMEDFGGGEEQQSDQEQPREESVQYRAENSVETYSSRLSEEMDLDMDLDTEVETKRHGDTSDLSDLDSQADNIKLDQAEDSSISTSEEESNKIKSTVMKKRIPKKLSQLLEKRKSGKQKVQYSYSSSSDSDKEEEEEDQDSGDEEDEASDEEEDESKKSGSDDSDDFVYKKVKRSKTWDKRTKKKEPKEKKSSKPKASTSAKSSTDKKGKGKGNEVTTESKSIPTPIIVQKIPIGIKFRLTNEQAAIQARSGIPLVAQVQPLTFVPSDDTSKNKRKRGVAGEEDEKPDKDLLLATGTSTGRNGKDVDSFLDSIQLPITSIISSPPSSNSKSSQVLPPPLNNNSTASTSNLISNPSLNSTSDSTTNIEIELLENLTYNQRAEKYQQLNSKEKIANASPSNKSPSSNSLDISLPQQNQNDNHDLIIPLSPANSLEDYQEDEEVDELQLNGIDFGLRLDSGNIVRGETYFENPTKEGAIERWFHVESGDCIPVEDDYNYNILESDFNRITQYYSFPLSTTNFSIFLLPRIFHFGKGKSLILSKPGGKLNQIQKLGLSKTTLVLIWEDLIGGGGRKEGKNEFKPRWFPKERETWNEKERSLGKKGVEDLERVLDYLFNPSIDKEKVEGVLKLIWEGNWIWFEHLEMLVKIYQNSVKLSQKINLKQFEESIEKKKLFLKNEIWRSDLDSSNLHLDVRVRLERGNEKMRLEGELESVERDQVQLLERLKKRLTS